MHKKKKNKYAVSFNQSRIIVYFFSLSLLFSIQSLPVERDLNCDIRYSEAGRESRLCNFPPTRHLSLSNSPTRKRTVWTRPA
ncbi:hypothetical protein BDQ94DRAFT_48806 [Aspergillus welwitschiae]|uniref:Uncharacterized protein n=1 Tax=Aspergillus welwitschiae TaxID=1341132 RepID=A0A3F3QIR1_9EURO|nr:hypothetical protein BDQ94DRAFT_48806 [Aspergillus welwitschiae]RDH38839.1 hypothetical protein BDQ94DRAFT_48806 [Aspergillus welwitschiae]